MVSAALLANVKIAKCLSAFVGEDGTVTPIAPQDGKKFRYEEAKELFPDTFTMVALPNSTSIAVMSDNPNGEFNKIASDILQQRIFGNVLFCDKALWD